MTTVQSPRRNRHLATTAQHGMWFTEQLGTAGSAYHMPVPIRIDGEIDPLALIDACAALVVRHPVLGCAFEEHEGDLFAVTAPVGPRVTLRTVTAPDTGAGQPDPTEDPFAELVRSQTLERFDLRHGPLVRFTLFTRTPDRHLLLVVAHHLVFDGESKDILVRDLGELYRAFAEGGTPDLPALPTSYAEHADAEPTRLATDLAPAAAFWATHWREPAPVLLPGLRRQQDTAEAGATVDLLVDPCLRAALAATADALGATRFEVLLAALQAVLYRYGNTDPTVAVDLGTRTPSTRDCVGLFVNEVPLRATPRPGQTFRELVAATRADLRARYPIRAVPVAHAVARNQSDGSGFRPRIALAPVSVSYRRRASRPPLRGLTAEVEWMGFNHTARNALHVQVLESPEQLALRFQYSPRTLDPADVRRIVGHFTTLLTAATAAPQTPLADLDLLDRSERERVLVDWARSTLVTEPPAATLPELFAARAATTPDAPAVVFGDQTWSYGRLAAAVDRIAGRLRRYGVGPGTRVAVLVRRSPELLLGLLGVLRSGAAYVPLDPDHPEARLTAILADATPTVLLTDGTPNLLSPTCPTITLTEAEAEAEAGAGAEAGAAAGAVPWPRADDPAYLIYTSGSTGQPKGVQIAHGGLAYLLVAMRDLVGTGPGDGWLALASAAFDMSKPELFLPLVTGGRVVLAAESQTRDGETLCRLVRQHAVTHVHATPSTWRLLIEAGFDEPEVTGLSGAEALPVPLARELRGRVRTLWNLYGPTEATVWATARELTDPVELTGLGEPIGGTRRYLLDGRRNPVPIGVPGELHLGGPGLAQGYLNRPGLTAAHFVPDPYGPPGARLYRTGDLARYRHDGEVEFLGRVDNQVKIRGYRVELGEVEARLDAHPDVAGCAVALRAVAGGHPLLVAYLVRRVAGAGAGPAELRRHLAGTLPAYLLPNTFVELDRLPTSPNGKLDRGALPEPPATGTEDGPAAAGSDYEPAAGHHGLAREIFEIWRQVLRIERIGPDDDLFDLGGHSLTVTQIAARMRRQLGIDLPLHVFFDTPTIAGLVAAARADGAVFPESGAIHHD
ncbi:amino acid adenylation domain-containing protein [Micromonospora pisi]|uniref:Amino acid adenylation domain-containing protein n=1 Tax=Micromonospora pisi TaxID=589240 RepID=A0A495JTD7_9ACTN|nr:non-ribosomal peptide synthetase [Micromonospora pisi]RKR92253.1 amino acid adenylation domain-containing protein [Micromonospora pisi]